jgi:hypothetical protein
MASSWSSIDPARRRVFLAGLAVIAAILVLTVVDHFVGKPASPASPAGNPVPTRVAPLVPQASVIVVPPGHADGDSAAAPPSPVPQALPPRFGQAPALPVSDADLKAAGDTAMAFLEVFGNGRWDQPADAKAQAIAAFVTPASLDVVLAQYARTAPQAQTHDVVTYQVTGAEWWNMSKRQLTLLTNGVRRVVGDGGDHSQTRGFLLTLTGSGSSWKVLSVHDPADGDAGMGPP